MARNAQFAAEEVIRAFPWWDYGMDDISAGLTDAPEHQEWVTPLAQAVLRAILLHINYGSTIQVNDETSSAAWFPNR